MARAIWKGAINFSLIHIPVSLQTAAKANALDLDMLDKRDFSPVGYQRINKTTGKPVDWGDIVKGYQYEKNEYVVLTDEDFRRANVEATQSIDIHTFVDANIAPYYFETPYYLIPEGHGEKVYALLRNALARSHKLAIASLVIRSRQHMAALMPLDDIIVLNTLRYADEIVPHPKPRANANRAAARSTSKELDMALKLIDEMSEPWQPETYHDTYRDDLMKRIEQKIKAGQTKSLTAAAGKKSRAPASGKVVDLMTLLRQSLEDKQTDSPAPQRRHRAARRRTTSRATRRA